MFSIYRGKILRNFDVAKVSGTLHHTEIYYDGAKLLISCGLCKSPNAISSFLGIASSAQHVLQESSKLFALFLAYFEILS